MCTHVCMCINCGVFLSHCPPYLFLFFYYVCACTCELGHQCRCPWRPGPQIPRRLCWLRPDMDDGNQA